MCSSDLVGILMEKTTGAGTRKVAVIIDGNNHNIVNKDGKKVVFETEIEGNLVTLEKCQEVAGKARELGHEPKTLKFILSEWDDEGYEMGDDTKPAPKQLLNKTVVYDVAQNSMVIWQNGEPIYANDDGIICRNRAALADSLL